MVDSTGTTSWGYDAANEETSFGSPGGSQTETYDNAGRRTGISGTSLSRAWTYDNANRPLTIINEASETTTFGYDSAGRLSTTTLANGQVSIIGYDTRSRQTSVTHKTSASGSTLSAESYVYDDACNLSSKTVDSLTTTYGYDNANQLTSESNSGYSASYTYDANGNRASKTLGGTTQTYNNDNSDKLTSITQSGTTVKSYGYDAAGRTTSVVTSAGTTTLSYDYEGRLTGVNYPGGSTNSFTYNSLDARVGKTDSAGTCTYRRDGADTTSPILSDGLRTFSPGVSSYSGSASTFDLHDQLGSTTKQTSPSATVTGSRVYDSFGLLQSVTGTPAGPFGFASEDGYEEDADSGLKLLGHRYYDPSTGRFITRDPNEETSNWTQYTGNNPNTFVDRDGLIKTYSTPGEAAAAGIKQAWPTTLSTGNEASGGICGSPGHWFLGPIHTGGPTASRPIIGPGGSFHTHPPSMDSPDTSDDADQNVADRSGKPVYAGNDYGHIWKNVPRRGHAKDPYPSKTASNPRTKDGPVRLPGHWKQPGPLVLFARWLENPF